MQTYRGAVINFIELSIKCASCIVQVCKVLVVNVRKSFAPIQRHAAIPVRYNARSLKVPKVQSANFTLQLHISLFGGFLVRFWVKNEPLGVIWVTCQF